MPESKMLTLVEEIARVTLIDPPIIPYEKICAEAKRLQDTGLDYQIAYKELLVLTAVLLTQLGGEVRVLQFHEVDTLPEVNVYHYPNGDAALYTHTPPNVPHADRRYTWQGMVEPPVDA